MTTGATELENLVLSSIVAAEKIGFLSVASATLVFYDYILTFDQEVKYFWTGRWTLSRALFFLNRYLCPPVIIAGQIAVFGVHFSYGFCEAATRAIFFMEYVALTIIQGIIVLRIWYMFAERRRIARLLVVSTYLAALVTAATEIGVLVPGIAPIKTPPGMTEHCTAPPIDKLWRIYLPNLILHTVLFAATTWPVIEQRRSTSPLMLRLVRDGGIFYIAVFAASAFTTIASFRSNDLSIILPAMFSNFLLAVSTVSVSRLMFSIRSLASALSMDSIALLSAAELSRVRWRRGAHSGELIVEIDSAEPESEPEDRDGLELGDMFSPPRLPRAAPQIYTTRVGVYHDELLPGYHNVYTDRERNRRTKTRSRAISVTSAWAGIP